MDKKEVALNLSKGFGGGAGRGSYVERWLLA